MFPPAYAYCHRDIPRVTGKSGWKQHKVYTMVSLRMGCWGRRQDTMNWQELVYGEPFRSMSGKNVDFGITQKNQNFPSVTEKGMVFGLVINLNSRPVFVLAV